MKWSLPIALLAVSVSPPPAQAAQPPITRDRAMSLSPEELAQLVLGQVGSQVRTMTRPNFSPDSGSRMVSALQDLTFATAPRPAEMRGLCVADRIEVSFEHDGPNEAATAARPRRIRAAQVYKVIGEIAPRADAGEARGAEEVRRCADAGPVIEADYSSRGRPRFFQFEQSDSPATALLVLQRAIGEARAGRYQDIRCAAAAECVTQLGGLDLATLSNVSIGPMGSDGNRDLRRVTGTFLIEGDSIYRKYRTIEIEVEFGGAGGQLDAIRRLGRTEISHTEVYH